MEMADDIEKRLVDTIFFLKRLLKFLNGNVACIIFLLGNIILDGGGEQRQTHFLVGTRERSHC